MNVSVNDSITGDPIADALDTGREDISIAFREEDWPFASSLVRGDQVELLNFPTLKYRVDTSKIDRLFGVVVNARSC